MIETPRSSRRAGGPAPGRNASREDRGVADSLVERPADQHLLLDEQGTQLGRIAEAADQVEFGPLEPTIYLHREIPAPSEPDTDTDTDRPCLDDGAGREDVEQ
jgi:hypothetical protein